MSTLQVAMPTIFLHEGRYVNDPHDPGGATNYGISLRFLLSTGDLNHDDLLDGDINHDGDIDIDDIKVMTPEQAMNLYNLYWWSRYNYGAILNQTIATKLLDLSINMGNRSAVRCLQRALRASNGIQLEMDGILGPKTLEAVNKTSPDLLLPAFKQAAAGYYQAIVHKNPAMQKYLKGWLNRAYANAI